MCCMYVCTCIVQIDNLKLDIRFHGFKYMILLALNNLIFHRKYFILVSALERLVYNHDKQK